MIWGRDWHVYLLMMRLDMLVFDRLNIIQRPSNEVYGDVWVVQCRVFGPKRVSERAEMVESEGCKAREEA